MNFPSRIARSVVEGQRHTFHIAHRRDDDDGNEVGQLKITQETDFNWKLPHTTRFRPNSATKIDRIFDSCKGTGSAREEGSAGMLPASDRYIEEAKYDSQGNGNPELFIRLRKILWAACSAVVASGYEGWISPWMNATVGPSDLRRP